MSKKYRIWCEAGHGGSDPGAVANNMRESDITLEVSLHLRDMLSPAFTVGMARETDVNLVNRVVRANAFNPDLIICPHVNAGGGTGVEVVIPSASPNNPSRDLAANRRFAENIAQALGREFNMRVRRANGVMLESETRHGSIGILRQTTAIAVMPEMAFIDSPVSNPDVDVLRNRRKDIARVMAEQIYNWFGISMEVEEMFFRTINDIPEGTIRRQAQRLIDEGTLVGTGEIENGAAVINVTETMIRTLTIARRQTQRMISEAMAQNG